MCCRTSGVSGVKRRRQEQRSNSPAADFDSSSEDSASSTSEEEPVREKRKPAAKRAKVAVDAIHEQENVDNSHDQEISVAPHKAHVDVETEMTAVPSHTSGRLNAAIHVLEQQAPIVSTPPHSSRAMVPDSEIRWGGEASPIPIAVQAESTANTQGRIAHRRPSSDFAQRVPLGGPSDASFVRVGSGRPKLVSGGAMPRDGTPTRRRSVIGTGPAVGFDKIEQRTTGRHATAGFEVATTFNRFAFMRTAVFSATIVILSIGLLWLAFFQRDSPTEQCAAVAHRVIRDRAGNVLCGIPADPLDTAELMRQVRERATHLSEHACDNEQLVVQELHNRGVSDALNAATNLMCILAIVDDSLHAGYPIDGRMDSSERLSKPSLSLHYQPGAAQPASIFVVFHSIPVGCCVAVPNSKCARCPAY
jgi:hypothetical protein